MKAVVNRKTFLSALEGTMLACEKRTHIPILSNVQLTVAEGVLALVATDLEHTIFASVEATDTVPGSVCLKGKELATFVKVLDTDTLVIEQIALPGETVRVKVGSAKIVGSLAADFPSLPVPQVAFQTFATEDFLRPFERVGFAISHDETRHNLNCVNVTPQGNYVATDGHRLAISPGPAVAMKQPNALVAFKAVTMLRKLAKRFDDEIEVGVSEASIVVKSGAFVLVSRLVEGMFPDYLQVIPKKEYQNVSALFDREVALRKIKIVSSIFAARTYAPGLKLALNGALTLMASNPDLGEVEETMPVLESSHPEGATKVFGLSGFYFREALENLPGEGPVTLAATMDELEPVTFQAEDTLVVVMPMRL